MLNSFVVLAGAIPEVANSRLAMLGVFAAVAAELGSGMNVFQQVKTAPVPIALTFLTLFVATAVPVLRGEPRRGNGFWSADAEIVNGRCAQQLLHAGLLMAFADVTRQHGQVDMAMCACVLLAGAIACSAVVWPFSD